jgi:S1-C subfamily serine protease
MLQSASKGRDFGIRFNVTDQGIRVTEVRTGSAAKSLGLEPGDTILTVYGHPVTSAEVWNWLTSVENDYAEMEIRDGRSGEVLTRYARLPGNVER